MIKAKRSEIWLAHLASGEEARPVLVLSNGASGKEQALTSCLVRTTELRGNQYEVIHDSVDGLPHGAFDAQSVTSIPDAALESRVGNVSMEKMAEVDEAVRAWLGL